MFYTIGRLLRVITNATALAAGAMICVMMFQVAIDVLLRYFFNSPLPATIVFVSNYYMLFVVFLPLAVPERTDAHVSVGIVTERLPESWQKHLRGWVNPFCAAIYFAIAWASWGDAMHKFRSSARVIESGLSIQIWPGYFVVPLGCSLIGLVLTYKFLAYLTGWRNGLEKPVQSARTKELAS